MVTIADKPHIVDEATRTRVEAVENFCMELINKLEPEWATLVSRIEAVETHLGITPAPAPEPEPEPAPEPAAPPTQADLTALYARLAALEKAAATAGNG